MLQQNSTIVAGITCNTLSRKDLLAKDAPDFYDGDVTDSGLWEALGWAIREARERQGFASTNAFKKAMKKQHRKAPAVHTMDEIEEGNVANLSSAELYCSVLGIDLRLVLKRIVCETPGVEEPLKADAYAVGRAYQLGGNHPDLTKAMWGLAVSISSQAGEDLASRPEQLNVKKRRAARTR